MITERELRIEIEALRKLVDYALTRLGAIAGMRDLHDATREDVADEAREAIERIKRQPVLTPTPTVEEASGVGENNNRL